MYQFDVLKETYGINGHFWITNPIGILVQVWYLIVSIPDLCTLTYFYQSLIRKIPNN